MKIHSKLPKVGTTIFTVMSALARQHGAINLSQGFPNFDCPEKLKELVSRHMAMGHNQYAPMAGVMALRERLAQKIETLYGLSVNPETEITITAGATQAIFTAISAFVQHGDEVVLIEPAYDSYGPSVEVNGGKVIAYELEAPGFRVDWERLQSLFTPRTRMLIVNTPHNPTGKIFDAHDLEMLHKITAGTDILVLSDEVYEHLVFDGAAHQSAFRNAELFQRCLATFSFGKTFHNTGWKMGYCVAPARLMAEFRKVHQFNVFSVNTPVQHGIADFLEDPDTYLSLPEFYQKKRDLFLEVIAASRFRTVPSEGTYFQLVDYSRISDENEVDFARRMTIDYGVAAIPISVFYGNGRDEKVVRLCFAKTEETLERAGELLCKI